MCGEVLIKYNIYIKMPKTRDRKRVKGSWRDSDKGDCWTKYNVGGGAYVVCKDSVGQRGAYKKKDKEKPTWGRKKSTAIGTEVSWIGNIAGLAGGGEKIKKKYDVDAGAKFKVVANTTKTKTKTLPSGKKVKVKKPAIQLERTTGKNKGRKHTVLKESYYKSYHKV